jgi:hypothetical protein
LQRIQSLIFHIIAENPVDVLPKGGAKSRFFRAL